MPVVPLTIIISLTLVFSFVIFFLREHARGRISSPERDSLLPLSDEQPRIAHPSAPNHRKNSPCGCHDGSRPPCPGCLHGRH